MSRNLERNEELRENGKNGANKGKMSHSCVGGN